MFQPKHRFRTVTKTFSLLLVFACSAFSQDEKKQDIENRIRARETKITNYDELVEAFKVQGIKVETKKSARTLLFRTRREKFEGVMVVKWDNVNGVVHLIQTWPMRVPAEKTDLFLKAAQTLNHGFLFPGIGVNLSNGGAYYRLSIPVSPRNYLYDYELGTYTRFAISKAAEFMPTMQMVMDGKVKVEELILYHQKYVRSLAAKKAQPVKLTGRYSRTIDEVEWVLDFSESGKVKVFRDGKLGVESKLTLKGDECALEDLAGPLAAKEPGTYRIVSSDDKLTFRALTDSANERKSVLAGGTWKVKK